MGWLVDLFVTLLTVRAAGQIHENRRRGIRTNWPKALMTGGGSLLISGIGIACLFGAMQLDQPAIGFVLFAVVFVIGMIVLITQVNHRWP
jgi:hypothetical protein